MVVVVVVVVCGGVWWWWGRLGVRPEGVLPGAHLAPRPVLPDVLPVVAPQHHHRLVPRLLSQATRLITQKSRNVLRAGIFRGFIRPSTRTMQPHGAYLQTCGRNRIDPHWGGGGRHAARTASSTRPISESVNEMVA